MPLPGIEPLQPATILNEPSRLDTLTTNIVSISSLRVRFSNAIVLIRGKVMQNSAASVNFNLMKLLSEIYLNSRAVSVKHLQIHFTYRNPFFCEVSAYRKCVV